MIKTLVYLNTAVLIALLILGLYGWSKRNKIAESVVEGLKRQIPSMIEEAIPLKSPKMTGPALPALPPRGF